MKKFTLFPFILTIVIYSSIVNAQDLRPRGMSPDGPVFDIKKKGQTLYMTGDFNRVGYLTGGSAYFQRGSDIPDLNFSIGIFL
jgi:hypothetical protein